MAQHRVVIIGGGFGGLYCARSFRRYREVDVTLLDRRNFHLFQPLLYQVATGSLSPSNIAVPLRALLRRHPRTRVLLGDAVDLDPRSRVVMLANGDVLPYDTLIIATGSTHAYFGRDEWEPLAPGLKSIENAVAMRRQILYAFEAAEREPDPRAVTEWLTFIIVGGGPTGVELAGAIAEIARDTLRHDFRTIQPADSRILLVEGNARVLSEYRPQLSAHAKRHLEQLGVEVMLGRRVVHVGEGHVTLSPPEELIRARTILWGAGVQGTRLSGVLELRCGAALDSARRVIVEPDCSVPGYPEVFVIGDLAHYAHQTGESLPGVAQVAIQQGKYVARLIGSRVRRGREVSAQPFRYRDLGTMATIGRAAAVAQLGSLNLHGLLGWLAWVFIHLLYIVGFHNKLIVLFKWAWSYVTRNRSARLITGEDFVRPVSEA